jgi:hypothetical protein
VGQGERRIRTLALETSVEALRDVPSAGRGDAVSVEDWVVRPVEKGDGSWLFATMADGLAKNSYFHGVSPKLVNNLAAYVAASKWDCTVVCTADEDHEPAGWVIYRTVPTLTIAYAHVDEAFRGLGAWRALRDHIGLKPDQLVGVVLASPTAMKTARSKYQAKHNWGLVLEWLS